MNKIVKFLEDLVIFFLGAAAGLVAFVVIIFCFVMAIFGFVAAWIVGKHINVKKNGESVGTIRWFTFFQK